MTTGRAPFSYGTDGMAPSDFLPLITTTNTTTTTAIDFDHHEVFRDYPSLVGLIR